MSCGCNGLGAYFKDRVIVKDRASRASRVVGVDKWGRAIATDGFGAYYLAVPGQMFSGFGAATAFVFDAAAAWSDWVAGKCSNPADYSNNQAMCTIRGKRAVNSIRAALAQLGFGVSTMSVAWSSEDQGKYKEWAAAAGQTSANGMPEKAHLQLMEQQISQGLKPGPGAAVSFVKVGDEIVQGGAAILQKAKAMGWKTWALIGAGVLVVGGVIYAKKHKKPAYTSYRKSTEIEPYKGPALATANRRRSRKHGR